MERALLRQLPAPTLDRCQGIVHGCFVVLIRVPKIRMTMEKPWRKSGTTLRGSALRSTQPNLHGWFKILPHVGLRTSACYGLPSWLPGGSFPHAPRHYFPGVTTSVAESNVHSLLGRKATAAPLIAHGQGFPVLRCGV